MPVGRLISFREGMQTLTQTLAGSLGDAVLCGAGVTAIRRDGRGWQVETPAGVQRAARLVLSVPAYRAAPLLESLDAELAADLAAIRYPPLASVALGFGREQVAHPLDGFGMLIPSRAGRRTLGVLFSSTLFPDRAPAGQVLLTAFIGGVRNEAVATLDEAEIVRQVLADLTPLLGIRAHRCSSGCAAGRAPSRNTSSATSSVWHASTPGWLACRGCMCAPTGAMGFRWPIVWRTPRSLPDGCRLGCRARRGNQSMRCPETAGAGTTRPLTKISLLNINSAVAESMICIIPSGSGPT